MSALSIVMLASCLSTFVVQLNKNKVQNTNKYFIDSKICLTILKKIGEWRLIHSPINYHALGSALATSTVSVSTETESPFTRLSLDD